ncbi:MAG TPA: hemolysin family protein [Pyrinomonadaceae bacterium]|jgi:CBS domain containing-hemolysin-like protein|nr:hemolysin family protein [Pyrinomonadaceae bacterium]
MEIEIVIAVLILVALVFLATIDMAFSQLSDVSLRRLSAESEENQNPKAADFLREILENRPRFRFALSSAIQVLLIGFAVLVTIIVLQLTGNYVYQIIFSLVVSLFFSVIFRQIFPRLLIWKNPENKLMFLLPLVRPIYGVVAVLVNPFVTRLKAKELQKLETTVTPDSAEEKSDDNDDFQALMEVGEAEGIIEEKERELIETMVEFSETKAGEIMTPRTEICALPIDASVKLARDLIIEEKYSRLPVFRENIDNIEGILYVRDLLNAWAEGKENESIEPLLRDAFFIPETKSAAELLKNMQSNHVQIAIVIDEYGGVAGMVTVEDILEEIVGEIEDEDIEEEEIIEIIEGADGYFDVLGSTEIGKIERLFDMEIEDDDFTTIAGLVTSEVGYVPKPAEKLNLRGLDIEIVKADEKRIHLLRLRKATDDEILTGKSTDQSK